ncbi:PE-PPE domain-containing protein [Mycobacterium sp.]|uniref:PE-PPE domain-containing protein n=1 Tax=Mycobacterium sp. TaxID=1785 RepID=UPI003C72F175
MNGLTKVLAVMASITVALSLDPPAAKAGGVTYTLEPFDYDGVNGTVVSLTKNQLGGTLCPCVKVSYPADGAHNAQGVTALVNTPLHAGDTVLGFSLGSQVVALYLSKYTPPPGVRFILLGDTFTHNDQIDSLGQGVPASIANQVILVARQYDGWSDYPTNLASPNYQLAWQNAQYGGGTIHDYVNVRLDNPANVVVTRGNITGILIPTQHLPLNDWRRWLGGGAQADQLDAQQRPLIDSAYNDRPGPTPDQVAGSTAEQVANT